jgi:hypothetical protein
MCLYSEMFEAPTQRNATSQIKTTISIALKCLNGSGMEYSIA